MIGGKTHGATKPTALGTMLNASTYGLAKYTVIGTTRAPLYPIWAANLRKGPSSKKAKKGKGPPTYVENVDFFFGSNPIEGALQVWSNNTNRYTLDFIKLDINAPVSGSGLFPWMNHMTIVDSNFYFVLAVTIDIALSGTFNDYGDPTPAGTILVMLVSLFPGSGYAVNDTFRVTGGNGDAIGQVTAVSAGVPTAIAILNPGSGYSAPSFNVPTVTLTGSGSGLQISITKAGKQSYDQISEHPMWNLAQHGPNIVRPQQLSLYPFVYYWTPAFGNVVYFPAYNNVDSSFGYHIYYARLNKSTRHEPPIQYNRMHFEPVLAGPAATQYADAGLTSQQDPHPCDAGLGSSDIDLGVAALLPDWRVENKGSHALHAPRGDADFVDMIQDTLISGQLQVGAQLGLLQRGVNCNDLPGLVQQYFDGTLEPVPVIKLVYPQPNAQGSLILAFFRWRPFGGANATIADTAVDAWTNVFAAPYCLFAYATSVGATGNVVSGTETGGFGYDSRGYIFEMDPGSNTVIDSDASQGSGASVGQVVSVTVNVAQPCYLLVAGEVENYLVSSIEPHWKSLLVGGTMDPLGGTVVLMKRYVSAPGTYTFSLTLSGGYWNLGIVAIAGDPSPLPKALGDIIDHDSLELTRTQCWANGLIGSIAMLAQRKASEWIQEFLTCANADAVWSGFVLKVIPRSEVSFAGNGVVYIAPTASGPVAKLTVDDLVVGAKDASPVVIKRKGRVNAPGIHTIEFTDRDNDYDVGTASEPEPGANTMFGPKKIPVLKLEEIQSSAVARKINVIEVRHSVYLQNLYVFTAMAKWIALEAKDLIQIPDPNDFESFIDVRLTKVQENDQYELECEAEPFIYGLHAPNDLAITIVAPNIVDSGVVPASVNAPVFLEPPTAATVNNAMELWIGVSDSDPAYGGCVVNISTDGGASYNPIGEILGSAITGLLTQDWPAGLDPDFVNDLKLDLTESLGDLANYPLSDENNFVYPFYVEGSTTCGYELGSYSTATLTAAHKYTLPASPNGLRRDVYHQPLSGSVDHPIGKRFLFLGAASAAGTKSSAKAGTVQAAAIMKLPLQPLWEGQTLYFKFQAFNEFGGGVQDLADCTPYTYVPGACAVIPSPEIITIPVTSPAPGNFTIAHGLLTTPIFAVVQMTSGGDIWLQRPLSVDGTNVYLVASAGGLTANISFFYGPADASVPLSPSAPGSFTVPHGLASTPTLGIVQMDSAGDIWKDATPYTSTNLNLVAAAGGITGKDYAWITAPRTPTLTRFAAVALAPGAPGNFSVPHGLGVVPKLIIVRMSSGGRVWLQVAGAISADATNLLLTASAAGITGEAEVWA